ncbi:hypothetical protein Q7A36_38375, partial [Paracraurococcus sp. LOR1-02]|nr:hypothetical protein [Paracraurococcus sp. LOR1-02]
MGIPRNRKVYGADVELVPPAGRKRHPASDQEPRETGVMLADMTWRPSTKGPLVARFAATRVRVGDGATWANNCQPAGSATAELRKMA